MTTLKYSLPGGGFEEVGGEDNKLDFNSFVVDDLVDAAENGHFYSFVAFYSSSDNDDALYFRNTSTTQKFHCVVVNVAAKSETVFTLNKVTGLGSGTSITGINWNFASGNTADAVVFQDAGTIGTISALDCLRVPDSGSDTFEQFNSLVLGEDDAIAVRITKGDAETCVVLIGYYKDI